MFRLLTPLGIALGLFVGPVVAQPTSVIHFSGLAYEEGTFPPSAYGEALTTVGSVTQIAAPLFWSPSRFSYTVHLGNMLSLGETVYGATHVVEYVGGTIAIFVDTLPSNATYGVNPPNTTCPTSFMDGSSMYLEGHFDSFTMTFNTDTSSGGAAGQITFTGGNAFPQLESPTGWTVGAQLGRATPQGYDLDWNGALYVDGPTATAIVPWGRIKSLYR